MCQAKQITSPWPTSLTEAKHAPMRHDCFHMGPQCLQASPKPMQALSNAPPSDHPAGHGGGATDADTPHGLPHRPERPLRPHEKPHTPRTLRRRPCITRRACRALARAAWTLHLEMLHLQTIGDALRVVMMTPRVRVSVNKLGSCDV